MIHEVVRIGCRLSQAVFLICAFLISHAVAGEKFNRLTPDIAPGYAPADSESEGGLWMSVENAEHDISTSPLRIRDERLNNYVRDIICKLAPDYCVDIRVYIMRVPYFNASMYPNGMMVVWSGLLLRVRNEAQLAAVLGHEMGHYFRKHSLKRFNDLKTKANIGLILSIGLSAGAAATGTAALYDVNNLSQIMLIASMLAYSRDSEREADQYGIQLVADAGYDPHEVANIWTLIRNEEAAAKHKDGTIPFLATHPSPKERERNLEEYALSLSDAATQTGWMVNDAQYLENIRPHLFQLLKDELNLTQYDRTEYLFDDLLNNCKGRFDCDAGLLHFFNGELHRLRNGDGDTALAKDQYRLSLQFTDVPAETYRALGLLELKERRLATAKNYLREYLQREQAPGDREMIEYYLSLEE